jgi:hypothetical protein
MMICTKALRASRLTSLSLVIGHSAAAFTSPATNASGDGGAVHFQGIVKYSAEVAINHWRQDLKKKKNYFNFVK